MQTLVIITLHQQQKQPMTTENGTDSKKISEGLDVSSLKCNDKAKMLFML